MPKQIRDPRVVPRGNYTFTVKETGREFNAHVFPLLVGKVREHMQANGIPVPINLTEVITQDYCERKPDYCFDPTLPHTDPEGMLAQVVGALAIPAADALHKIGEVFGINCAACNKRHRIIREIKKVGVSETLRRLKGTF